MMDIEKFLEWVHEKHIKPKTDTLRKYIVEEYMANGEFPSQRTCDEFMSEQEDKQ